MALVPPIAFAGSARGSATRDRRTGTRRGRNIRRLLICSRSHAPHGGADRIIADLCRELPARGWQVILGLTQGARFNDVSRYLQVMGSDLPARSIDGRKGTRGARIAALRRIVGEEEPDVVLSMRVFDAYEAVALEKASGRTVRLAVGVRSFEPNYLADLALYRDCVDLCVTSGKLIATMAVQHCGLDPARVASIGGGVHPPVVAAAAREPSRPLRLLYAGRLDEEQKRIGDLPRLLDELDRRGVDYELHMAGIGPAEDRLREQLAERIARGSVRFHGWVSREALYARLYPMVDIFVHFAAWEGMTIAPREAMAHGVVPVISRFPGWRIEGQFRDGTTALTFPVGDVAAAADCIARLAGDVELMARLSEKAMRSQAGRYSFEGSMDAWAKALDRCMELPLAVGRPPDIRERVDGRLARLGLGPRIQGVLRALTGRHVQHASPGSEWPTASGRIDDATRRDLDELARALDEGAE